MKTSCFVIGIVVLLLVGCTPDPKSGKGFTLPEGDIERGQQTFAKLNCQACHTVAGVTFDAPEPSPGHKMVALGGAKSKVQTYGDLVTSIINPSHRFAKEYAEQDVATDGESKMRLYNDEMTVQQLIDLVTFLESHYSVIQYAPTPYGPYYY
jgi:mono/diheme cytochrome c family protein